MAIAFSADNFRTFSARVPDLAALTADGLLISMDYSTPFVADFNRIRDRWLCVVTARRITCHMLIVTIKAAFDEIFGEVCRGGFDKKFAGR